MTSKCTCGYKLATQRNFNMLKPSSAASLMQRQEPVAERARYTSLRNNPGTKQDIGLDADWKLYSASTKKHQQPQVSLWAIVCSAVSAEETHPHASERAGESRRFLHQAPATAAGIERSPALKPGRTEVQRRISPASHPFNLDFIWGG